MSSVPRMSGVSRRAVRLLPLAVAVAIGALLAACGSTVSTTGLGARGSQQPTRTVTATVVRTATSTTTLQPPPGVVSCGAVFSGAAGTLPGNAHDIEACFYASFQSCHPASLLYTDMGVDTQSTSLFVVQPGASGGCGIARTVKYSGCCGGMAHQIQSTDTCAGVYQQNGGYVVRACGRTGDVPLP